MNLPLPQSGEYGIAYDSKRRFVSYWHQIREIVLREPRRVLEVGIGSGFVSKYLRGQGMAVTTIDIDASLKPDVIADIAKLPFPDASYDVVTAYEVLEHMPYGRSLAGLCELSRVSSRWVAVSLPDATHAFRFACTLPRIGYVQRVLSLPILWGRKAPYAKSHTWEIGIQQYPLGRIISDMEKSGFELIKTYRVFENPYHRFFILRKVG